MTGNRRVNSSAKENSDAYPVLPRSSLYTARCRIHWHTSLSFVALTSTAHLTRDNACRIPFAGVRAVKDLLTHTHTHTCPCTLIAIMYGMGNGHQYFQTEEQQYQYNEGHTRFSCSSLQEGKHIRYLNYEKQKRQAVRFVLVKASEEDA